MKVKLGRGYKTSNEEIKILRHADDALPMAENEDDLRPAHIFDTENPSRGEQKCTTRSQEDAKCGWTGIQSGFNILG